MSFSSTSRVSQLIRIFDPEIRADSALVAQIRHYLQQESPAERAWAAELLATITADELRRLFAEESAIRTVLENEVLRELLR